MDFPFKKRLPFYLAMGVLITMTAVPPIEALARYFDKAVTLSFYVGFWQGSTTGYFAVDFEMRSTWKRIFCFVSVQAISVAAVPFLPRELPYELFSNGFMDLDTWLLLVFWVISIVACIHVHLQIGYFESLLCYAQESFPYVVRTRLLRLAGEAMRSGDPFGYIDNYEFPAVGG